MSATDLWGTVTKRAHPRFHPDEPHALVLIDTAAVCPCCGGTLYRTSARQDALLIHGGYGATTRTERRGCMACTWSAKPTTAEERPPRRRVHA